MRKFLTSLALIAFIAISAFVPLSQALAQSEVDSSNDVATTDSASTTQTGSLANDTEDAFEAKILQVLDERHSTDTNANGAIQQNLQLKGLDGAWKNQTFEYVGISDISVFGSNKYNKGDRVLVQHAVNSDGKDVFYVVDFIRRPYLYVLAIIFVLIIIFISRGKGFRALLGLAFSFLIIMEMIVPLILNGWSPVPIGILGSVIIFTFTIYVTEGFNKESHLAILTMFISLTVVGIVSIIFTSVTRLTGTAQEETMFLIGITKQALNFKGLLLTGILIGTLGVLDDIIIGQIEAVIQIKNANPYLPWKKVFDMALHVGNSHMGSMVNTLFLAYAGAAMPLLLLFSIKQPPFMTYSQVINNEIIATEIVRTLVGSIGLALSMPIATYLAARYYHVAKPEKKHPQAPQAVPASLIPEEPGITRC